MPKDFKAPKEYNDSKDYKNAAKDYNTAKASNGAQAPFNHTKRQHPSEWASGSSGHQRKTTADGQTFVRGTTRNPNKRSKAWRSVRFVKFV